MKFRGLFLNSLILFFLLATGWILSEAQSDASLSLKIAFVSNRDGNEEIYVIPADASRTETNLSRNAARDWNPTWSPDGDFIAFNSNRDGYEGIYIMRQDGTRSRPLFNGVTWNDHSPAWSPDGSRIAFVSNRDGLGWDLYTATPNGEDVQRLTNENSILGEPAWSPDGSEIVYWLRKDGRIDLYKINVTSLRVQRLTTTGDNNGSPIWSPDNSQILYDTDVEELWSIYTIDSNGNRPRRVSPEGFNNGRASFSPTSQYIAFTSDRSDISDEIYIMRLDGTGLRALNNNDSSEHSPAWQPQAGTVVSAVIEGAPEVVASPTPNPVMGNVVGQSVSNGVEIDPMSMPSLLLDYGFGAWHDKNWRGQGVRIGVIDTGFGGLDALENAYSFEVTLPPNDSMSAYSGELNDHGTDVLEVIHEIAPEAQFYACRYDGFLDNFKACTEWMKEIDVQIINHSAGTITLPLDGTNAWAQEVNYLVDDNILWINSAGNFNLGFYEEDFTDRDEDGYHEFAVAGTNLTQEMRFTSINADNPYAGNILLSWSDSNTSRQERLDLDIEVFPLADPSVSLGIGVSQDQNLNRDIDPFERVFVSSSEPFGIRIVNRTAPTQVPVQLVLFVEFLPIENPEPRGSILSPADASGSLTVGAVQGASPNLAAYSSRGILGTVTYQKPDVSAPGEFRLRDASFFVGTSAASPVIAGAAALLLQANPELRSEELKDEIVASVRPDVGRDVNLGSGVFTMPEPPLTSYGQSGDISFEAFTVFPRPEDLITVEVYQCIGAFPSRLEIGMNGYVSYNLGLRGRSGPGTQYRELTGQFGLLLGTEFEVRSGPVCEASLSWWEIALEDGSTMWVGEGASYPFIAPINLRAAQVPLEAATAETCPFAPPSQFEVRDRVITRNVPAGGLTIWRSQNLQQVIGGLPNGTELHLLGGPVCHDESKFQWFVRVLEGEFAGVEGYVSEAVTGERWLEAP